MTDRVAMSIALLASALSQQIEPADVRPAVIVACAMPGGGMCIALAEALERAGRRVEIAVPHDRPDAVRPATVISYIENERSAQHIVGHLRWTSTDGRSGRGETMVFDVIDAPLTDAMLGGYADALVHRATLPD